MASTTSSMAACDLPGEIAIRRVSHQLPPVSTAMMPHVTTTGSVIGTRPIVNTTVLARGDSIIAPAATQPIVPAARRPRRAATPVHRATRRRTAPPPSRPDADPAPRLPEQARRHAHKAQCSTATARNAACRPETRSPKIPNQPDRSLPVHPAPRGAASQPEAHQHQWAGPENTSAEPLIQPSSDKCADQRRHDDHPAQHANLRELTTKRWFALPLPLPMPLAPHP